MKYILILPLWWLFSLNLAAQTPDDTDGIRQAIQLYFEGYLYGDLEKLNRAFASEQGHMYALDPEKGVLTPYPFTQTIARWVNRAKEKPFTPEELAASYVRLLSLDIQQGLMAFARIEIQLGPGLFVDGLSLYKMGGEWKIVSKVFVKQ